MTQPQPAPRAPLADWEAFYANYRKPGYVPGFEITSKLGGGMFGLVFKATRQSIGKDYAIKFLKVDDGEVRGAVLQELEQVRYFAQVDHPNLVAIEDRGEVDGIPYLVMAYAGAETLKDRLPGRPEQRNENLRCFLQACRGVAALHEKSLVHFDLKPGNVFLKGGVARVGDYGLSKLVTHSRGSLSMGRGTPYYMAPELLQRRGDHRSDVYSLGVMLYEVLTGELPFRGDNEWEVLKKHETAQVAFPAHVGPRERAVVERCLAKDPSQRFQSVHDLIAALGAPASAAAAAMHDRPPAAEARASNGTGQRATGEDPYAGFRKASREAYTHASRIAREAMARARVVAHKAAADARRAWQGAMQQKRHKHLRRWAAWRRLMAWRRETRRRQREAARAARRARRHRAGKALAVPAVIVLVALAVFSLRGGRQGSGGWTYETTVAGMPPDQVHRSWQIPRGLERAVATGEPRWVANAGRDLAAARKELETGLRRFEGAAPLAIEKRLGRTSMPDFGELQLQLDGTQQEELAQHLQQLAGCDEPDEETVLRLRECGRDALFAAALQLEHLPTDGEENLRARRNLQQFLEEETGFHKIEIADDSRPPSVRLQANQDVGLIWRWFLNEVALTQDAWDAYRKLRR